MVSGMDVLSHGSWLMLSLGAQPGSRPFPRSSHQATSGLIPLKPSNPWLLGQQPSRCTKHPPPLLKPEVGKD